MKQLGFILIVLISICAPEVRSGSAAPREVEVTVLDEPEAANLLTSCDRGGTMGLSGYWHPDSAMVAEMNAPMVREIRRALARVVRRDLVKGILPTDYRVQYGGFYQGNHRVVCANGFLAGSVIDEEMAKELNKTAEKRGFHRVFDGPDWRTKAIRLGDGGIRNFGVLYDVERGRFSDFEFNNMFRGRVELRPQR
jgi:hypothetical protein